MSVIAADRALLSMGESGAQTAVAGLRRRRLTLSRTPTDRTEALSSPWSAHSSKEQAAHAEIAADGVFLSSEGATSLRNAFISGNAETFSLQLPGEGTWAGAFLVRQLILSGDAEGELMFSVRLSSTGPIQFTAEMA